MSNFRYGGNVQANGIRQHYLRYGGRAGRSRSSDHRAGDHQPGGDLGFVGERFGEQLDTILDMRGRGLSRSGPQLDYGLDAQAEDLLAFARARWGCRATAWWAIRWARGVSGSDTGARARRGSRLAMCGSAGVGASRRAYP